jgi:23S rRNA G2069 N7-methylase RlmK/C1962 C5-methylase RlmI
MTETMQVTTKLHEDVRTWLDHHRHTARFLDEQQREDVADFLTRMIAEREAALTTRTARLEAALRWVNGEGDDFPGVQPENRGRWFWRREMMQRAGLDSQHIDPTAARALAAGAGRGEVAP